jgi:hypothetical protein
MRSSPLRVLVDESLPRIRNRMTDLRPLIPQILGAIAEVLPGEIGEISG